MIAALADDVLRISIPWGQVGLSVVAAGLAGVLAALVPAWQASKRDILEAIGYE